MRLKTRKTTQVIKTRERTTIPTTPTIPPTPQLKVWWIPQVPGKPFVVLLNSFAQAKVLLDALAQYDLFQLANNVKPDYSNAGGLEIYDASCTNGPGTNYGWTDFYTDDGDDIDALTLAQCVELDAHVGEKKEKANV